MDRDYYIVNPSIGQSFAGGFVRVVGHWLGFWQAICGVLVLIAVVTVEEEGASGLFAIVVWLGVMGALRLMQLGCYRYARATGYRPL